MCWALLRWRWPWLLCMCPEHCNEGDLTGGWSLSCWFPFSVPYLPGKYRKLPNYPRILYMLFLCSCVLLQKIHELYMRQLQNTIKLMNFNDIMMWRFLTSELKSNSKALQTGLSLARWSWESNPGFGMLSKCSASWATPQPRNHGHEASCISTTPIKWPIPISYRERHK